MEKIYMIPVNDAYNEACGCPICRLRDKAETNYLEYYLGPSLMEPDTRKITNKTGFCPVHMGKLNQAVTNRLGLGLVMHTHLKIFTKNLILSSRLLFLLKQAYLKEEIQIISRNSTL